MKKMLTALIFDRRCDYFVRYLNIIETTIDEQKGKLKKISLEVHDEQEYMKRDEYLAAEGGDLEEIRQLMYRSFVISIFASMEEVLIDLCNDVQSKHSEIFSYDDLGGNGVQRALKYLEKIFKEKFPIDSDVYNDLKVVQEVRNVIVHNGARLKSSKQNALIWKFIKDHPKLLSQKELKVLFTLKYAESLIKLHKDLCSEVLTKL